MTARTPVARSYVAPPRGGNRTARRRPRSAARSAARLTRPMSNDGMWLPTDQDPRQHTGITRGELACLEGYLEAYRQTLEMKCDGLDPAQLASASVPPSAMSLLGLVRHLARVEHHWFRRVIGGRTELPRLFDGEDEDAGFSLPTPVDPAVVEDSFALWRGEVSHARQVLAGVGLDTVVEVHGQPLEVRDLVVHMVEEYARHAGHADLLRECVDGRTGQ